MGELCYCVLHLKSDGPAKLLASQEGTICDKCERAGYRPEEAPRSGELRVSRRADKYCPFCGKFWGPPLQTWGQIFKTKDNDQSDNVEPLYLCEECAILARRGGTTKPLFVWEIGPAVPLEERFDGLFRAARALLREEAHEDKVLPTLALEGLEINAGSDWGPWSKEAANFYTNHPRVRLASLEDGILVLERREADVEVALEGDTVVISIAPRPKPPTRTEVAAAYERAMTSWDKPFDIEHKFSLDAEEEYHILRLRFAPIQPLSRGGGYQANYPSPRRVSDVYWGLREGSLGKGLETRPTGRAAEPDNLVPAIVAFYLRTYGGLCGRKGVYALLNEHVLCERSWSLPDGGDTDKHSVQLWNSVKSSHKHLVCEMLAL